MSYKRQLSNLSIAVMTWDNNLAYLQIADLQSVASWHAWHNMCRAAPDPPQQMFPLVILQSCALLRAPVHTGRHGYQARAAWA